MCAVVAILGSRLAKRESVAERGQREILPTASRPSKRSGSVIRVIPVYSDPGPTVFSGRWERKIGLVEGGGGEGRAWDGESAANEAEAEAGRSTGGQWQWQRKSQWQWKTGRGLDGVGVRRGGYGRVWGIYVGTAAGVCTYACEAGQGRAGAQVSRVALERAEQQ